MSTNRPVVHSDPEILGGQRYSWARGYRCAICSTILNEDTASTNFLMHFPQSLESKRARPWKISDWLRNPRQITGRKWIFLERFAFRSCDCSSLTLCRL